VYPVRYYCPRCETVVTLQREGYLADKSVTPFPLEGWTYAAIDEDFDGADGVRIVCGDADSEAEASFDDDGCGEPYYLNFVRFEDGDEVEPAREAMQVRIAGSDRAEPTRPTWPGR
jgi:hypothetical protein